MPGGGKAEGVHLEVGGVLFCPVRFSMLSFMVAARSPTAFSTRRTFGHFATLVRTRGGYFRQVRR